MLLTIVLAVLGVWVLLAVLLAFTIGRAVHLADRRRPRPVPERGARDTTTAPARKVVVRV